MERSLTKREGDGKPNTKPNALELFGKELQGSYLVEIENSYQFNVALELTSAIRSFRQTAAFLKQHRDASNKLKISGLKLILSHPTVWSFVFA
uniref:Uncharacterized protein n=1 Tax=Peronospora matthiolae TaxID=2874970 RepID=A0AAV1TRU9_9STRA